MAARIGAILLLLVAATWVSADFPNGFAEDGFVFHAGRWYDSAGTPHTRVRVDQAGYWYCGRYYNPTYYYRYTVSQPAAPALTYKDPGWRGKLLDIAAARDKTESAQRLAAFEQAYFEQSLKALGLQGNFSWSNYGMAPPYALGGSPSTITGGQITNYGANASTGYGYSFSTIASIYGDTSLNQLYQQASQLALDAQRLGGEANADFQSLVKNEGDNRSRVAEILAKGQMAGQVIAALQAPSTVQTKGFSFTVGPKGDLQRSDANVPADAKADISRQWLALAQNKCAACHSGATKRGGFDIAAYPSLPADAKQKVWLALVHPDDKKRMPRAGDGTSPGKPLSLDELRLFFLN